MSLFRTITGTQSKAADRYAIDVMKIPSLDLMENASAAAAEYIIGNYGRDSRIVLCCGIGNNGADGICIGRILKNAGFSEIYALICGKRGKTTWEFDHQLAEYEKAGLGYSFTDAGAGGPDISFMDGYLNAADVLVDAVFGIGLHRPVEGVFRGFLEKMEASGADVIAVDIPSGIDSDTGEVMGAAVRADVTVSFGCGKTGLYQNEGPDLAGKVVIADIGIPEEAYRHAAEE